MTRKIVSIANQKGGVGKTTTAINLGAVLAVRGHKILLIDLDPQGNASTGLGIRRDQRRKSSYDLLLTDAILKDVAIQTGIDGLDIVPATSDLSSADADMMTSGRRLAHLRNAVTVKSSSYDYILIDCPPSLNLLTLNAFVACHSILVPLQAEFFALEGLSQLLLTIREIRESANPRLRIEGVVLTMFDQRNNLCQQVEADARENLGFLVYDTKIPRNVKLSEAPSYASPIINYEPTSRGAIAYRTLASEFLKRNEGALADHV